MAITEFEFVIDYLLVNNTNKGGDLPTTCPFELFCISKSEAISNSKAGGSPDFVSCGWCLSLHQPLNKSLQRFIHEDIHQTITNLRARDSNGKPTAACF
jgi:hypothetical protein